MSMYKHMALIHIMRRIETYRHHHFDEFFVMISSNDECI